jgi:hypothetical protein
MEIEVEWSLASDSEWEQTGCLYAYLHPETDEILYIGKADGKTVRQRYTAANKKDLFDYFKDELGVEADDLNAIVGNVWMDENRRLSRELLADIESLLISRIQPPGNIQKREARISRPGMVVTCTGQAWKHDRTKFVDR